MRARLVVTAAVSALALAGCGESDEGKTRKQVEQALEGATNEIADPTSRQARSSPEYIRFRAATAKICGEASEASAKLGKREPSTTKERVELFEDLARVHQQAYEELSGLKPAPAAFSDFQTVTNGYGSLGGTGSGGAGKGTYERMAEAAREENQPALQNLLGQAKLAAGQVDRASDRLGIPC